LPNSSANFSRYPLLWLAVCFSLGILTAGYISFDWKFLLVACFISAIPAVIFIKKQFVSILIFASFFILGAFWLQIENQSVIENRLKNIFDENRSESGEPLEVEGILIGKPELAADGFLLKLKAEKMIYKGAEQIVSGKIKLFASIQSEEIADEYAQLNLQFGSRIRVACRPERDAKFLNEGVISRKQILDQQDIDASAVIKSPLLVEKIGDAQTFAPLAWIYEQRQNLIIQFRDKFTTSTAGIMIASLLGNKYFLDKHTSELFREGGTFHVLVISGLHITFIGGLTLLLLKFFTKKRLWQFILANLFLWSYTLAVGADVPVVRAALMFTILLFSQVIYRNGTLLNSLGFCAFILLIWRPNDLFNPSFQLTFVSVGAIVAFAFPLIETLRKIGSWSPTAETPFPADVPVWLKRFCEMLYWRESVWEFENKRQIWSAKLFKSPYLKWLEAKNLQTIAAYLFEGIIVSLIVQMWLLPLLIFYFHRVSIASILLNIWVGFFIALETFAALIALFFAQFSTFLALPLLKLTEIFNWFLLLLPEIFVSNDWASFRVPVYSGAMKAIYLVYFVPILISAILLNRWKPFDLDSKFQIPKFKLILQITSGALLTLIGLVIFHPFSSPMPDGKLHVEFLDVGQGDSTFVTFPNGETLLIDGGGKVNFDKIRAKNEDENEPFEPDTQNIGETVVSNFLWQKGYSKVDYILATHADTDHIQGLTDIAKNFRVRGAFFGRTPAKDEDFVELQSILNRKNIPSLTLSRGDVLTFGDVKVEILYPETGDSPEAVSDNNHSVVLRVIYGSKKFLLTGDIERETEIILLQNPFYLQADIVKVPHHGSRTSSTEAFINATKAEYSIIPVGRHSMFGHPHEEIVERWKKSGAKIYTTGERGTISMTTDGKNLEVQTFLK
jgi:competence protein ComEC